MKKKLTWASFIFGKLGEPIKAHFMSNRWTYQAGSNNTLKKWKSENGLLNTLDRILDVKRQQLY
jgi:hypothetical protein